MKFELKPVEEILKYMRFALRVTKNKERKKNLKELLEKIDKKQLKAFHGFDNEYGEHYIIVGYDLKRWWWAGDESDWETTYSFYESNFVAKVLKADREAVKKHE